MAGGVGTRFWPLSRAARPKQLLPLGGSDSSLLRETQRRIAPLIAPERTFVVCSELLAEQTRAELPELPPENILAEPLGRNTAPCVGWATSVIARIDPEAVVVVLPADHHIADERGYLSVLETAVKAARDGDMVTVGIKPTRPETGYGYVELGEELAPQVYRARRFVEKPDQERAQQFLAAGRFLWNSGMFFFRADIMLAAVRQHLPSLGEMLSKYDEAAKRGEELALVRDTYASLPNISIDHGVMEEAARVAVVPGDFGWSDVGSWTSAWELAPHDAEDNALFGHVVAIDTKGSYVRAREGKVVAVLGLEDIVVVDTEDAVLVMPRSRAQDVRAVVNALKQRDSKQF
ncbi:MAG TPA: mannose-1-phosphate guanylyltransferase [Polyangiales bacterium]|nr:mannose-1-phosphate guanylyltransferase [Polyangiales bacterium]